MNEEFKNHGVTENTSKNILLGAGAIYKNLSYNKETKKWNTAEALIGATSGGNKVVITPGITDVEVDGALVKVKGLTLKQGETARLETNLIELTPELIKTLVIGEDGTTDMADYNVIVSKASIEDGDYWDNVAFVGKKTDGTPIIVILDNVLCTTGFDSDNKKKEGTVFKATFECYAEPDSTLDKLPYHIYYPKNA